MTTRREFLRRGSLWVAAGIMSMDALDQLDWARHRVYALGSSLNRARMTLLGSGGQMLRQVTVPIRYVEGTGDTLMTAFADRDITFTLPGQNVYVRGVLIETPFTIRGTEVVARRLTPVSSWLADGNSLTVQRHLEGLASVTL